MKLIDSKIEPIIQNKGLLGIYKQIELCGRTCYKSENNITEDSCNRFVQAMINNGHTAMLEHGTVYLTIPDTQTQPPTRYIDNPYSKVRFERNENGKYCWFVTTNYRVLVQNKLLNDLIYLSEPTAMHYKRYCFRIICDRGVSHEIVRHRKMSFAQESTRYCNYSKDKFGNELTFIKPTCLLDSTITDESLGLLKQIEEKYIKFSSELKPEQLRAILPNCIKTEICVTGFEEDWKHFLDLRSKGTTGKPHPDIKKIADEISNYIE